VADDTSTTTTETAAGPPARGQRFPRTELGKFVSRRTGDLQRDYLRDKSSARGALAQLRRTVGHPVGSDPVAWAIVFDGFPEALVGRTDEPSRAERAAYAALGLFAVHMQSATREVHRPGVGLGVAVRQLASPSDGADRDKPVMRRFQALGTADVFEEALHHARGLIQQFRHPPEGRPPIALDYGLLAEDLADLQNPARRDAARLRWARDLYVRAQYDTTTPTDTQESK